MRQLVKWWTIIQLFLHKESNAIDHGRIIPEQTDENVINRLNDPTINECFQLLSTAHNSSSAGALCFTDVSNAITFLQTFNNIKWREDLENFPVDFLFKKEIAFKPLYRHQLLKFLLKHNISSSTAFSLLLNIILDLHRPENEEYLTYLEDLQEFLTWNSALVNRIFSNGPNQLPLLYHGLQIEKKSLVKLMLAQPNTQINIDLPKPYEPALIYMLPWKNITDKLEITSLLLQKKATLYRHDPPKAMMEFAVRYGSPYVQPAFIELLIDNGASVNYKGDSQYASSPLSNAILSKNLNISQCEEVVTLLIAKGADIDEMIPATFSSASTLLEILHHILKELHKKVGRQDDIRFFQQRIQLLNKLKSRSNSNSFNFNILLKLFFLATVTASMVYGLCKLCRYCIPARKQRHIPKPMLQSIKKSVSSPAKKSDKSSKKSKKGEKSNKSSGEFENEKNISLPPEEIPDLLTALEIENDDIVKKSLRKALINKTASINDKFGEEKDSLLMYLVRKNLPYSIKFLVENANQFTEERLDFNYVNSMKETAILISCKSNKPNIAQYLLKNIAGLRTGIRDEDDKDALFYAKKYSQQSLISKLESLDPKDELITKTKPTVQAPSSTQPAAKKPLRKRRPQQSQPPIKPKVIREQNQRKNSDSYIPPVSSRSEPKQHYEYNFRAGETIRHALQNLAQVYAVAPENPRDVFLRHCKMIAYIFMLLAQANEYSEFMEEQHAHGRTIVDSKEFGAFRTDFGHQTLPLLIMGLEIKNHPINPLIIIEETAAQLVKLMPAQLVQKTSAPSNDDLKEFYSILGLNLRIFDPSAIPPFPLKGTKLDQFLKTFHDQLTDLSRIEKDHESFVVQFALPVLKELSEDLANDTRVSPHSQEPLLKSKLILDFAAVQKHHPQFWQVLLILLAACGDMVEEAFLETSPIGKFIRSCRNHIRNIVLHPCRFRRVSEDAAIGLCEDAKNLAEKLEAKPINWNKTSFGVYYLDSFVLAKTGLFAVQRDIVLGYLDLPSPRGFEPLLVP